MKNLKKKIKTSKNKKKEKCQGREKIKTLPKEKINVPYF